MMSPDCELLLCMHTQKFILQRHSARAGRTVIAALQCIGMVTCDTSSLFSQNYRPTCETTNKKFVLDPSLRIALIFHGQIISSINKLLYKFTDRYKKYQKYY